MKSKETQLLRLIEISNEFISFTGQQLSYQEISDYMLELSGAKYVGFNLYDESKKGFKTVAISGINKHIKKAGEILGFTIEGKVWDMNLERSRKIKDKTLTIFENLQDLSQGVIENSQIQLIQETFKLGLVIIVNITNDKEIIGDFTLIIGQNKKFSNKNIVELYASQVALLMEKTKTAQECEKSKKRLENIIEATNIGTWEWNIQTGEIILNERWAQMLGYSQEEYEPENIKEWLRYLNIEELNTKLKDVFDEKETYYSHKYRVRHKQGHWVTILDQGRVVSRTDDGQPLMMIGTHLDITESEQLKDEYERFFAINLDLFCIADMDGNLINVNDSWERLLGYSSSYLENQNFLEFVHPEDITRTKEAMSSLKSNEKVYNFINRYRYCDGSYRYIEWISQPYDNLIYGSGRDITESYERQKEVEYLSFRDYLTGLYNRRYMEKAIERLDTDDNLPLTVMVMDINGLKLTNDAFGHKIGDKLIITVAEIMKQVCGPDDIIGRMGGDEFLILLPNTDSIQASEIKEEMIKAANNSKDQTLIVSFAIGYAVKTKASQKIIQVEKNADKNMYRHKVKYGKIMRNDTIQAVLDNVFHKDHTERIHAQNVSLYCEQIAKAMGLCQTDVEEAKMAGLLHDIGKIAIPDKILNKAEKLKQGEWEEIKRHTITSYNILKSVDKYAALAEAILYHHERPDGKGYPEGLNENEIPLLSKIIAVADAYEAMTSKRLYKKEKTKQEAIEELKKHSGPQFDPEIVDIFINKVL